MESPVSPLNAVTHPQLYQACIRTSTERIPGLSETRIILRMSASGQVSVPLLINYLKNRQAYIPNYRERRAQRQYIGSAHVEKGNDLIVARRQKHQGMHWSEKTSDALAALRTLMLNDGWDLYWQKHQVLPLAVPVDA
jgi:hypothetical protein